MTGGPLLIGIGNADRGDDAAGLLVASIVRGAGPDGLTVAELHGDQLKLLDAWEGRADVYVADALCSGGVPGTVYRFDAATRLTDRFRHPGTHAFSLTDVIELARALGRLPGRLSGYGIEGTAFGLGDPVSPAVQAAATAVAARILAELKALPRRRCSPSTSSSSSPRSISCSVSWRYTRELAVQTRRHGAEVLVLGS